MKTQKREPSRYFSVLPIALILLIVPLIVQMKIASITPSAIPYWKGGDVNYDFFSYYKMVWFLIFTVTAAATLFIKLYSNKYQIKKTSLYIPMVVYILFAVLSSLLSKTKDVAVGGFPDRYEGIFVLIAYMAILFIVINVVDNENQIKLLIGCVFTAAVIIGLIGAFQYFNMDLFQTTFGKKLMLPSKYWDMAKNLTFSLGPRAAYGTLYHTNYMGSFTAMLLPLSMAVLLLAKNTNYKIVSGILSALMFLDLMASHSRAGIVGGIFAVLILIIIAFRNSFKKVMLYLGILVVTFAVIAFIVNWVSRGEIVSKIATMYNDSIQSPTAAAGIKDISVNKNLLSITDPNGVINITTDSGKIAFTDKDNRTIPSSYDKAKNAITFPGTKFSVYTINILNYQGKAELQILRDPLNVSFVIIQDSFKLLINNQIVDIAPIQRWGFKGNENLGSARGYIWSRSLPLLKNTLIVGYGPDTFAINFPQNDYLGKLLAYNDPSIIVDKPHNLYLQAGLNTGVISLLALLALFVMYFISSVKIYFTRGYDSFIEISGLGVFLGTCGYLIAGLFNDSVISVAPVFWVLLGMGISINMKLAGEDLVK